MTFSRAIQLPLSLLHDPLHRNALYLMLATAVLSGFGFLFWMLAAHLFSDTDIGLATTLISTMNLISLLSLAGFNLAFVRFLPEARDRSALINTGLIIVAICAAVMALVFVALTPLIAPDLRFIHAPLSAILFITLCVAASLNTLTDSVFLAERSAQYTLYVNALYSAIRLGFPFLFIGLGAAGIFAAAGLAQIIGVALSIVIMMRRFHYRPRLRLALSTLKHAWRYTAGNYAANLFGLLPPLVLPILVVDRLGAENAAYYYIAMMMANLLYVIPYAATRSLFAEGSNDETTLARKARASLAATLSLVVPAIVATLILAPFVLRLFGASYAAGGTTLLRLMALAALPLTFSSTLTALFQVRRNVRAVVAASFVGASVTLGASTLLLPLGLAGIGLALILGPLASAIAGLIIGKGRFALAFARETRDAWRTRIAARRAYARARARDPRERAILFYPHTPRPIHILYAVCHHLGYDMTSDPRRPHEAGMAFEDATIRTRPFDASLPPLHNRACDNISKEHVEDVFAHTFGYGMRIDPRTHHGVCVRKSNDNATHDGAVVPCPRAPEEGYIYQRLIDNECGDGRVSDIRLIIYAGSARFACVRYRSLADRFNTTLSADIVPIEEVLSETEHELVRTFCRTLGLDHGELDVLRDRGDGRIYIVDANNTPSGPTPGVHLSREEYENYVSRMAELFLTHVVGARAASRTAITSA